VALDVSRDGEAARDFSRDRARFRVALGAGNQWLKTASATAMMQPDKMIQPIDFRFIVDPPAGGFSG
jgi:hypothetical protein